MRCKTERSPAGTAGKDGNPPLRPPRPTGKRNIGGPGGAHRTDRTAVNTGGMNASIEPPVIGRVSRQARTIAFCKVERHGHDDTRCRSLGPTPFWGCSPVLASNSRLVLLHLIASAQDGDLPVTRRFRHLTSSDLAGDEIASAPIHRSRRRYARMHPLRFGHSGRAAPDAGCGSGYFDDLARVLAVSGLQAICVNMRGTGESRGSLDGITVHDLSADVAGVLELLIAVRRTSLVMPSAIGSLAVWRSTDPPWCAA